VIRFRIGTLVSMILLMMLAACGTADPAPVETLDVEQAQSEDPVQPTQEIGATSNPDSVPAEVETTTSVVVFQIVEEGTEARFIIDEVLRGEPKTVIGATNNVTGEIRINLDNPAETEVGQIVIEAGTLRTDNNFRNGAIENFILQTGSYPFISFSPTVIQGLPAMAKVGDVFTFELTGDLTIREISRPVTFSVTVTAQSEAEIRGAASTTVLREDYELNIPSVPQVAGVANEVLLELDFTARR
jgi:polyisoprenoid-binding protein YceI